MDPFNSFCFSTYCNKYSTRSIEVINPTLKEQKYISQLSKKKKNQTFACYGFLNARHCAQLSSLYDNRLNVCHFNLLQPVMTVIFYLYK